MRARAGRVWALLAGVDVLRFALVQGLGLIVDIGLSLALARGLGLALPWAAAAGFLTGAAFNYLLHEIWTFRVGSPRPSVRRAVLYLVGLGLSFAARVGAVAFLVRLYPAPGASLAILIAAVGLSFCVNFLYSRGVVFRSGPRRETEGGRQMAESGEDWQVPAFDVAVHAPARHPVALVIPILNEGARIRAQLERLKAAGPPVDIVIADGGSTDGAIDADLVTRTGLRAVLTKTGPGRLSAQLRMAYAWCLREGYDGIVTIDGNGKDGVDAVGRFVARLAEGYDYVQGSRYRAGGLAENTPLERTLGNRLIHAPLLSLAGCHWYTDTTNGFRGYSRRYLLDPAVAPFRDIFVNYELLFYLTVRAGQLGYRCCEVPVQRRYPATGRTPTKITGAGAKVALFGQTLRAALGRYRPDRRA